MVFLIGGFDTDAAYGKVFEVGIPANAAPGSYTYLSAVSRAGEGSLGILSIDECLFQIREPVATDYYVNAELGDDANALIELKRLIVDYPESEYSGRAEALIQKVRERVRTEP